MFVTCTGRRGRTRRSDRSGSAVCTCLSFSPAHIIFWRIGTRSAPTRHRCRRPRARPPRSGGPGPSARSVALAAPPFVSGSGGRYQSRCRTGRPAESVHLHLPAEDRRRLRARGDAAGRIGARPANRGYDRSSSAVSAIATAAAAASRSAIGRKLGSPRVLPRRNSSATSAMTARMPWV